MATQTRDPTSELAVSGTWTDTSTTRWPKVDDYPDSGNPITDGITHGTTTAGNINFGFSAFTVPAGSTAISVQVLYYDFKNGSQACNITAQLRIGSTPTTHNLGTNHNPGNGNGAIAQRTDDFGTTNPKSGSAWTVDDVNGVGTNGLVGFGWVSTDANPSITLSCIQLQVTYTPPATPAMAIPPEGMPLGQIELNRQSPQANGLVACLPLLLQGGVVAFDLSGYGHHGTLTGFDLNAALLRAGLKFAGDNDRVDLGNPARLSGLNTNFSILAVVRTDAATAGAPGGAIVGKGAGGAGFWLRADGSSSAVVRINDGTNNAEQSFSITTNVWTWLAMVVGPRGAGGLLGYKNGVQQVSVDTTSVGTITSAQNWYIGFNERNTVYYTGLVGHALIYDRALTAAEVWDHYNITSRWDLYLPIPRRILTKAPPAGTVVTPAAVTMVVDTVAPTIILGSVTVAPAAATAVFTKVDPTVVLGSVTVAPATADAVFTKVDPTVVLGSVTVSPATADAVFAKVDPTVVLGSTTAEPAAAAAVFATVAPTVVLGSLSLSPNASSAVFAAVDPTVLIIDPPITPAAATAVFTTVNPTVVLGSITIAPTAASAVFATVNPTVLGGGLNITPAPATAVFASVNPTLVFGSTTATPSAATAVFASVAPTVILGSLTLSPTAANARFSGIDPTTILGSITLSPAASGMILSTIDPTLIFGSITASPSPVAAVFTTTGPTVVIIGGEVFGQGLNLNELQEVLSIINSEHAALTINRSQSSSLSISNHKYAELVLEN